MSVRVPPFSLGAQRIGDVTRFALHTSCAERAFVRLMTDKQQVLDTLPMQAVGDGYFELSRTDCGPGTLYKFVLDDRELPDPHARFLPFGVHGPAMVVEPRYAFQHATPVYRPLAEHVIYELHVGTFTRGGTYQDVMAHLSELKDLGVTALELMPVAAFPGRRGWGYDGVALFAPHATYGTPDELRALVDAAHGHGLSVLLDVVYNHFGPDGNYLSAYCPDYFHRESNNAWGAAPNYQHPVMRALLLDNVRYWLTEFGFDGLRFDAVHALVNSAAEGTAGIEVIADVVQHVRSFKPEALLIAEDDRNEPALVERAGLDAVWADDFHHQLRVALTGERDGYYACYEPGVSDLARTIEQGFLYQGQVYPSSGKSRGRPARSLPAEAFVYCIQNHDQVGNRALGERLSADVSLDAYCMVSMVLLFLPMTPLLFMGQEWAASSPFLFFTDHAEELGHKVSAGRREEFKHFAAFSAPGARERIPDPQAEETFLRSVLHHDERDVEPHARVLSVYRSMLRLRAEDPVFRASSREQLSAEARGDVLVARRTHQNQQRILLANFGKQAVVPADLLSLADPCVLLASHGRTLGTCLPPEHAVILGANG